VITGALPFTDDGSVGYRQNRVQRGGLGQRNPAQQEAFTHMPTDTAPEQADSAALSHQDDKPVLPAQSSEDTDVGWGDYVQQDDDRLLADRPPHWDDV
jgi:hypothetical protein